MTGVSDRGGAAAHAHAQTQRQAATQNSRPAPGRSERGATSYSEKTNGTVAEHEAMQSTVMNRVASGKKYWVDKGQELNEHTPSPPNPRSNIGRLVAETIMSTSTAKMIQALVMPCKPTRISGVGQTHKRRDIVCSASAWIAAER